MNKFLATYSSDFIGLTGDPREVKPIAKQFSVAFFKGNESPDIYQVSHSPQAFVLDRSGQLRAELYSASTEAMAGVANALLDESFAETE
jgi:cytochrome oxidase Cu insertion factor (SCO1/SenC/PrrC family)